MNREQVKPLIPILEAWAEGKVIQYRRRDVADTEWTDFTVEDHAFGSCFEHRVKPEPHDSKWAAKQIGKFCRRTAWRGDVYWDGCRLYSETHGRLGVPLSRDDILADDWELYEPK